MAVEILPSTVVALRRSWVGMAGCVLDAVQRHVGIERERDEGVPERVRVHP